MGSVGLISDLATYRRRALTTPLPRSFQASEVLFVGANVAEDRDGHEELLALADGQRGTQVALRQGTRPSLARE